jgi:hypothetical protein
VDLHRLSAWANIGSFFVGVVALICIIWPKASLQGKQSVGAFPLPLWIFLGVLLMAGVLHFAAARIQSTTPDIPTSVPNGSSPMAVPIAQLEGRVFLGPDITSEFLTAFFKDHTTMQAKKMVETYIGKWITASGHLRNVSELNPWGILVFLESETGDPDTVMTFPPKWIGRLSVLRPGNRIDAIGKIERIDYRSVKLNDCELIDS